MGKGDKGVGTVQVNKIPFHINYKASTQKTTTKLPVDDLSKYNAER